MDLSMFDMTHLLLRVGREHTQIAKTKPEHRLKIPAPILYQ